MMALPASSTGSRKRKAAKVGTTAGSSKIRRSLQLTGSHISDKLMGSDDDDSSDEDEKQSNYFGEEKDATISVGKNMRAALSHLRDVEMEKNEYEEYAAWKDFNVDISLNERSTGATAAQNLVGMGDVESNVDRIDEGMVLEVVESQTSPRSLDIEDESLGDVSVIDMVDESVASENGITVDEQAESVRIEGRSARGRGGSARGRGGARSRANEPSPFSWSDDYRTYNPQQETYTRTFGPTIATTDPVEIFLSIWDRDVMSMIAEETDRYAWQIISSLSETEGGIPAYLEWDGTSVEELYQFFAIIIMMSFCVRGSLCDYWTTGILEMPKFREIMPRNKFLTLLRFFHFVDNENQPSGLSKYQARMFKIQPIIDHCNKKFAELFVPGQWLSLDESLLLWKGQLSFVQCIRTKATRFGVKSFELCDSVTGYLVRTILYGGKGTTSTERALSGFSNPKDKVVVQLMQGYLDCGHCLVMDNWYNQLFLTRFLKEHKTDVVGTMNRRRMHVPPEIKNLKPKSLERGAMVSRHCGDISLIAWMDVKLVTTVSTFHGNGTVMGRRAGKNILKPVVVQDYNKYMGGVDLKDGMLSTYLIERRRGSKWYMKVFKRMLNTSLLNSYIIYKTNVSMQGNAKAMTHRMFRQAVAEGLLQRFPTHRDFSQQRAVIQERKARANAARVRDVDLHLHCSVRTPLVPGTNTRHQRRCAHCSSKGRRHMVRWMCVKCNVPLEPGDCFHKYHNG